MAGIQTNSQIAVQILQTGCCGCGSLSKSSKRMLHLFQDLDGLTPYQKNTLINRYISLVEDFGQRTSYYTIVFHTGRTIVTVGSLIVPALLSIQYTGDLSYQIYWLTWFISLLVTTFNGVLTLFKIDKKYYFLHTTLEQLKSEAWQYIHLSGKYSGHYTKGVLATHQNQYVFFCHNMEKIKLKQVEEEYYKLVEHEKHGTKAETMTNSTTNEQQDKHDRHIAGLYTPTPDVSQMLMHQQQIAKALMMKRTPYVENAQNESQSQDEEEDEEPPPPQLQGRSETAASTGLSMR